MQVSDQPHHVEEVRAQRTRHVAVAAAGVARLLAGAATVTTRVISSSEARAAEPASAGAVAGDVTDLATLERC